MNASKVHTTDAVKKMHDCKTDLIIILGGMISQLQPLDIFVNKPVKDRLKNSNIIKPFVCHALGQLRMCC